MYFIEHCSLVSGSYNMAASSYTLSWNEFDSCASNSFQDLFSDQHFTDVTLATNDGKQIKAHKVILSACSSFFRNILLANPHQHPLIYLKDIQFAELQAIIRFVYLGRTEVKEEALKVFMSTAKDLEIDGLAEDVNAHTTTSYFNKSDESTLTEETEESTDNEADMFVMVKDFKLDNTPSEVSGTIVIHQDEGKIALGHQIVHSCDQCQYDTDEKEELKAHFMKEHQAYSYPCDICERSYSHLRSLNKHRRNSHTVNNSIRQDDLNNLECTQCDYKARKKLQLKEHILTTHERMKMQCDRCPKSYSHPRNLKKHIRADHSGIQFQFS